jgi:Holliday junction resolvase RusA-like endonuclease
MFTPEKTVNFESFVAFNAHNAMLEARNSTIGVNLFYEAVQVNLLIGVQIPASWSKKKQAQALAGTIYPTTKPDLDNCIKSVFDAMNGVVYKDDSQVVTSVVKKRYREAPGLWCTVFAIGDNA